MVAECAIATKRTSTDTVFGFAFIAFLLGLFGLLTYCIYFGDLYRLVNGYDNCGNVCGRNNSFESVPGCTSFDMTKLEYLIESSSTASGHSLRKCADQCPNESLSVLKRCFVGDSEKKADSIIRDFFREVTEDVQKCYNEIIQMFAIAFVASILILLLFKYGADIVVWFVLIAVVFIGTVGSILLWVQYSARVKANHQLEMETEKTTTLLVLAIIATLATLACLSVIIYLRKRIQLVIRLFKEAGKVVTKMPLLLFEPILTFICLAIIISLWLYFTMWIESAGRLTHLNSTNVEYVKDGAMQLARWYNILALLWCTQFVIACQHIVIAGAVATWYFTRDKKELDSPISNSFYKLIRHHLGTAAFGSLLIAFIKFIRMILAMFQISSRQSGNGVTKCISNGSQTCMGGFEKCLKYISRQAYIETAIYGYPLIKAGKMAFTRLSSNVLRVFVINSIGDFVLFLGKIAVVLLTVVAGSELLKTKTIHNMWMILILAGIFAYMIAHTFITVYEMAIDTIFLCFCEDYEHNDGMSRPYFMSSGLMEFVESSKGALDKQNGSTA